MKNYSQNSLNRSEHFFHDLLQYAVIKFYNTLQKYSGRLHMT